MTAAEARLLSAKGQIDLSSKVRDQISFRIKEAAVCGLTSISTTDLNMNAADIAYFIGLGFTVIEVSVDDKGSPINGIISWA